MALDGEEFNNCAILDEYELGAVLGQGGFGKVVMGKHISTKKKVAIKFMDISEQRKYTEGLHSQTLVFYLTCSFECECRAVYL